VTDWNPLKPDTHKRIQLTEKRENLHSTFIVVQLFQGVGLALRLAKVHTIRGIKLRISFTFLAAPIRILRNTFFLHLLALPKSVTLFYNLTITAWEYFKQTARAVNFQWKRNFDLNESDAKLFVVKVPQLNIWSANLYFALRCCQHIGVVKSGQTSRH